MRIYRCWNCNTPMWSVLKKRSFGRCNKLAVCAQCGAEIENEYGSYFNWNFIAMGGEIEDVDGVVEVPRPQGFFARLFGKWRRK